MSEADVRFEMRLGMLLMAGAVACAVIVLIYLAIWT
jgi:hypothetical protein